ncbi:MAG: hypothetical protein JWN04_3441, partial [Myxococcaceae bacterium]|nr:hypothetical protein [Myxococcaceae bacterium]
MCTPFPPVIISVGSHVLSQLPEQSSGSGQRCGASAKQLHTADGERRHGFEHGPKVVQRFGFKRKHGTLCDRSDALERFGAAIVRGCLSAIVKDHDTRSRRRRAAAMRSAS